MKCFLVTITSGDKWEMANGYELVFAEDLDQANILIAEKKICKDTIVDIEEIDITKPNVFHITTPTCISHYNTNY